MYETGIGGGHDVDAQTIKGVYEMNLKYINDFMDTFIVISLFDGMGMPKLLEKIEGKEVKTLKKNWIETGMPGVFAVFVPLLLLLSPFKRQSAQKD